MEITKDKDCTGIIACFTEDELKRMHEEFCMKFILERVPLFGGSISEDKEKITDDLSRENLKQKEYIELFFPLFGLLVHYDGHEKCVCFEMNSKYRNEKIENIEQLFEFTKEYSINDFLLRIDGNYRKFQLKQYKESLDNNKIASFIKKKIKKYGDIGDTNLIIVLQSKERNISNVDFEKIYVSIGDEKYRFNGQVLIFYNEMIPREESKHISVIKEVYPELKTSRIDNFLPSKK